MNTYEYYHDWLRDARAMERQAVTLLAASIKCLAHYPQLHTRLSQHLNDTQRLLSQIDTIIEHNHFSHSILKDAMSQMMAFGQAIIGMLSTEDIVRNVISHYAFVQYEIASYTVLMTAAEQAGDTAALATLRTMLKEEQAMADWLLLHLPSLTGQVMQHSPTPDHSFRRQPRP